MAEPPPAPPPPVAPATASGQARPTASPRPLVPPPRPPPPRAPPLEPASRSPPRAPGDPPPFDTVRAAFFLVAGVIGAHALIVLATVAACLVTSAELVDGKYHCHPGDTLSALLAEAMAAALAFAGFSRRP